MQENAGSGLGAWLLKRLGVGFGILVAELIIAALWVLIRTGGLSLGNLANAIFYVACALVLFSIVLMGVREPRPGTPGRARDGSLKRQQETAPIGWLLAAVGIVSFALSLVLGFISP